MRRGHLASGVGGTRSRHGSVIRYACLTASAARRIQASGVIFAAGPTSNFSRHLVEQQRAASHGVGGDALFLCPGIFCAPVSRRLLGRYCAKRSARSTKSRSYCELYARRAVASQHHESGSTCKARSADDAHLPPTIERLRYSDECLLKSCAKLRSAGATPTPADSRSQDETCGCRSSDRRTLDHRRSNLPGHHERRTGPLFDAQRAAESCRVFMMTRKVGTTMIQ